MPDPSATEQEQERLDWSALGQLVGVVVVLLPAVGAVSRFVAFTAEPTIRYPLRVAAAAPLPTLAGTGLSLLLPVGLMYVAVLILSRRSLRRGRERRRKRQLELYRESGAIELALASVPKWVRLALVVSLVAVLAAAAVSLVFLAILFLPAFPVGLFALALATATLLMTRLIVRRAGRLSLGTGWPILLVVFVYALASGGSAVELTHADYRFDSRVPLADGPHLHLGNDGSHVFLWSCDRRQTVVVHGDDVLLEEFLPRADAPTHPSLWDIVANDREIGWGLRLRCE